MTDKQSNASINLSTTACTESNGVKRFFALSKRVPRDVKRFCGICRQHGLQCRTRGHVCRFKDCDCEKCSLVRTRRNIMSAQIRLRRAQDKRFQRTNEPSEADLIPVNTHKLSSVSTQDVYQMNIENEVIDGVTKITRNLCYFCQKCKNHGILAWKKLHKNECKYANCMCPQCALIATRRSIDQDIKSPRVAMKRLNTSASLNTNLVLNTSKYDDSNNSSVKNENNKLDDFPNIKKQCTRNQFNDKSETVLNNEMAAATIPRNSMPSLQVLPSIPQTTMLNILNGFQNSNTIFMQTSVSSSTSTRSPSIATTFQSSPLSTTYLAHENTPSPSWEPSTICTDKNDLTYAKSNGSVEYCETILPCNSSACNDWTEAIFQYLFARKVEMKKVDNITSVDGKKLLLRENDMNGVPALNMLNSTSNSTISNISPIPVTSYEKLMDTSNVLLQQLSLHSPQFQYTTAKNELHILGEKYLQQISQFQNQQQQIFSDDTFQYVLYNKVQHPQMTFTFKDQFELQEQIKKQQQAQIQVSDKYIQLQQSESQLLEQFIYLLARKESSAINTLINSTNVAENITAAVL